MPVCKSCGDFCENFNELATHILDRQSTHQRSVQWALKFQMRQALFKPAEKSYIPLTEDEKENKVNCQRELSGESTIAITVCPNCRGIFRQRVEMEHVSSPIAWKDNMGRLKINCDRCRK